MVNWSLVTQLIKLIASVQRLVPFSPVEMVHLASLVMVIQVHNFILDKFLILLPSRSSKLLVECAIHWCCLQVIVWTFRCLSRILHFIHCEN